MTNKIKGFLCITPFVLSILGLFCYFVSAGGFGFLFIVLLSSFIIMAISLLGGYGLKLLSGN